MNLLYSRSLLSHSAGALQGAGRGGAAGARLGAEFAQLGSDPASAPQAHGMDGAIWLSAASVSSALLWG